MRMFTYSEEIEFEEFYYENDYDSYSRGGGTIQITYACYGDMEIKNVAVHYSDVDEDDMTFNKQDYDIVAKDNSDFCHGIELLITSNSYTSGDTYSIIFEEKAIENTFLQHYVTNKAILECYNKMVFEMAVLKELNEQKSELELENKMLRDRINDFNIALERLKI